jgi:hypothetical protein
LPALHPLEFGPKSGEFLWVAGDGELVLVEHAGDAARSREDRLHPGVKGLGGLYVTVTVYGKRLL